MQTDAIEHGANADTWFDDEGNEYTDSNPTPFSHLRTVKHAHAVGDRPAGYVNTFYTYACRGGRTGKKIHLSGHAQNNLDCGRFIYYPTSYYKAEKPVSCERCAARAMRLGMAVTPEAAAWVAAHPAE